MEEKLGGNIILSNFRLDSQEMIVAKKIIGNHAKRIREIADYDELKLDMKVHEKPQHLMFEINALLEFNGERVVADSEGFNPYVIINDVFNKLIQEIESKIRK